MEREFSSRALFNHQSWVCKVQYYIGLWRQNIQINFKNKYNFYFWRIINNFKYLPSVQSPHWTGNRYIPINFLRINIFFNSGEFSIILYICFVSTIQLINK